MERQKFTQMWARFLGHWSHEFNNNPVVLEAIDVECKKRHLNKEELRKARRVLMNADAMAICLALSTNVCSKAELERVLLDKASEQGEGEDAARKRKDAARKRLGRFLDVLGEKIYGLVSVEGPTVKATDLLLRLIDEMKPGFIECLRTHGFIETDRLDDIHRRAKVAADLKNCGVDEETAWKLVGLQEYVLSAQRSKPARPQ